MGAVPIYTACPQQASDIVSFTPDQPPSRKRRGSHAVMEHAVFTIGTRSTIITRLDIGAFTFSAPISIASTITAALDIAQAPRKGVYPQQFGIPARALVRRNPVPVFFSGCEKNHDARWP